MVGPSHHAMIVAEISGNHSGSLDRAIQLVEEASQTGAHAVKLQMFTPDTITLDLQEREFLIRGGVPIPDFLENPYISSIKKP